MHHIRAVSVILALSLLSGVSSAQGYLSYAVASASVTRNSDNTQLQPWQGDVLNGRPFGYATWPTGPTLSASASNAGGTFGGYNLSSSASADLRTGTLRAQSSASSTVFDLNNYSFASGFASFGDSFHTYSQTGPFVWGGNTATFSFDLTGSASSSTPALRTLPDLWQVELFIVPSGTLLNNWNDVGLSPIAYWDANQNGVVIENMAGQATSISHSGTLQSGNANLSVTFAPAGDFDWVLEMSTGSVLFVPGFLNADLSHTLNVGYAGPAGTYVESGSGVFPGTRAAVTTTPEPATTALMAFGILTTFGVSRRRRSAR